ncbi:hypothetical protein RJ639_006779 [Escallonia herrerae]|uniref:Uncharacterized protein n=1 Tax=Escallonia herrerae TaxID=1293975 RepID=A0AA88VVR5_9ASTE|nr:hypothetical protein RJ639_006779 [Escallonia herrerae]
MGIRYGISHLLAEEFRNAQQKASQPKPKIATPPEPVWNGCDIGLPTISFLFLDVIGSELHKFSFFLLAVSTLSFFLVVISTLSFFLIVIAILLSLLLVIIRLQLPSVEEFHNSTESNISILILHQFLRHLCGSDLYNFQQSFYLIKQPVVIFNPKVILSQYPESFVLAVRHMNVHIHPPRSQQCRIKPVLVVGSKNNDPFISTTRPQSIYEIQQTGKRQPRIPYSVILILYLRTAINILDHDNGTDSLWPSIFS